MKNNNGISQNALDSIKDTLNLLYESGEVVHVNINEKKLIVKNAPSVVTGVYNHFICLKSDMNGYPQTFTIKYEAFLMQKADIKEISNDISMIIQKNNDNEE